MNRFKYPLFAPKAIRHVEIVEGDVSDWEFIGAGMIRACYRIPGTLQCLKFYRTTEKAEHEWKPDTYWRIRLTRHRFWSNINMQEWRYYERLKKRLPVDVMAIFPDKITPVYSVKYGWGVKETLLLNYDGSPVRSAAWEMRHFPDDKQREPFFSLLSELFEQLVKHYVAMHDPQNILLQWTSAQQYRLRIVDFEPRTKALIPGLTYIKPFIRHRVNSRCRRYLNMLRQEMATAYPKK